MTAIDRTALGASLFLAPLLALPAISQQTAPAPDPALLAEYQVCSAAAETRWMPAGEAQACAEIYLLMKLSLLPDVSLEDFLALDWADRHAVQQEGYAAYLAWKERAQNPSVSAGGEG